MRVLEYGIGGSTLFFLERGCNVISIEHDPEWAQKLYSQVFPLSSRWQLLLIPPVKVNRKMNKETDVEYASSYPGYTELSFQRYARAVENYEDGFFDVVQIDGRARVACFKHAIKKVKRNGFLVLDDSERERYAEAHRLADFLGWSKTEFFGPTPYQNCFQSTCVWRRPER